MKTIKIIFGITWAFAGLLLMVILFPELDNLSSSVSKLPFMKINPRYSGGTMMQHYIHENCTLTVKKPVFNGFLKEKKTGFVQLEWKGTVPSVIRDSIDYDLDEIKDFSILIDRINNKSEIDIFNNKVTGIVISTRTSYGWAMRVGLER